MAERGESAFTIIKKYPGQICQAFQASHPKLYARWKNYNAKNWPTVSGILENRRKRSQKFILIGF